MLTGEEYRASLDDGRAVYLGGRRVANVAKEPVFAPAVDYVAAEYERYYQPGDRRQNPLMSAPRSREQLHAQVPAFRGVSLPLQFTYQTIMTLLVARGRLANLDVAVGDRVERQVTRVSDDDIRVALCITDAKGHRRMGPAKQDDPDLYVRVVERRADGIVIRGAKLHISSAPLCHEFLVLPTKAMKPGEEQWTVAALVPVNAPGIKLITRTPQPLSGDSRDYPLSNRRSVPISLVVFDDVFVPRERVFLDGDVTQAAVFAHTLGLWVRLNEMIALVRRADEQVGLAQLIAEANGTERVGHIQDKIDAMIVYATLLRAGLHAAISAADPTPEGYYAPDELFTNATKYYAASNLHAMNNLLQDIAGGSVVSAPSMADLHSPEIGAFVEKYMRTGPEVSGEYRLALFQAIRDATADTFGGWQVVSHLNGGGGLYAQRLVTRKHYDMATAKSLALSAADIQPPEQ